MDIVNKTNKETYNVIASKYVLEAEKDHTQKKYINNFINTFKGNKILDLGCGTGILAKYLNDLGYDVTGIDFSKEMLKIFKETAPNSNALLWDVMDIDKINNKFNGIIATHLLVHFNKEQILELFEKIKKIMTQDSSFFIQFVPYLPDGLQIEPLNEAYKLYRYSYDIAIIKELLIKSGYDTIYEDTSNITTIIAKSM